MTLQAIDHVQVAIPVGGEERARPFYRDLLGLIEQPKPADMARRGGAWFEAGGIKVHLGVELYSASCVVEANSSPRSCMTDSQYR